MKLLGSIVTFLLLIFCCLWIYLSFAYPLTYPLKSIQYFAEHLLKPQTNYQSYVIGFLPYWRLDQIQYLKPNELSELNYFSLSADTDGHITKITNGQTDPGWNGWTK